MSTPSFSLCLAQNVYTARFALLSLMASRDELLYEKAPALRKEYMDKVGLVEQDILSKELDVLMLHRKVELIQAALNRREEINLTDIDRQIALEREQKLAALSAESHVTNELPVLSDEDKTELQELYRDIIKAFHPELNPGITRTQRELYFKSVEAYKRQDLEAMRLISAMLFEEMDSVTVSVAAGAATESGSTVIQDFADELAVDYKLAFLLYPYFIPLEMDTVLNEKIANYSERRTALEDEITGIYNAFPFSAKGLLEHPDQLSQYLAELEFRRKRSEKEKEELQERIDAMTEGVVHE